MTEQEYKQAKQVLAGAPDNAVSICYVGYFYRWKLSDGDADYSPCYDAKQMFGYYERKLSDLRTMVEQYEEIQALKAEVLKLKQLVEEALPIAEFACGGMTDYKAERWVSKYDTVKSKETGQ